MISVIDCNNFYVSCERLVDPSLEGKPVVVLSNNDGVVISRSNEVKALGVGMAAPAYKFRDIFRQHDVKVFSANFNLYMQISQEVMKLVREYSPEVEVYSVDEAFIDLQGFEWKEPAKYLKGLRDRILREVGIPASVGIAESKTLAKVATEIVKTQKLPDGVLNLTRHPNLTEYLAALPVGDLWGVGRQFNILLNENNIFTALELLNMPDHWTLKHLHIGGLKMVWELRGISCIPVEANVDPPKQIMRSRSFGEYVTTLDGLKEPAALFMSMAAESLRAHKLVAGTAGVFVHTNRFNDDPKYSNSINDALREPTSYTPDLISHVHRLLEMIYKDGYKYQKLGVMLTNLGPAENMQLTFGYNAQSEKRQRLLMETLDKLNAKYREIHLVMLAAEGLEHGWRSKQEHLSTAPVYVEPNDRTRFLTTVSVPAKKERHTLEPAQQSRALGKQIAERLMME